MSQRQKRCTAMPTARSRNCALPVSHYICHYLTIRKKGGTAMDTKTDTKQYPVTHTDAEWHKILSPEQFRIMREHGTEAPGSCALNHEKRAGTFSCAGCGQPLFMSKQKFESGTGWPSFNDPVPGSTETSTDRSYFMTRTEVHCNRCGSHLGHVFEDGPPPTHLRYCINGVAMNFKAE
jgi:peptide-methionine (R)-S-oxide reductase